MKKLMTLACAAALAVTMVGCDTSEEDMLIYSKQGGQLAGMFFNTFATKMSAKDRNFTLTIINTVSDALPVDKTFEETWMPKINEMISKAITEGKLSQDVVPIITTGCQLACRGIDYIFVKHPDWKTDSTKVNKIVQSFILGFTTIVTPADTLSANMPDGAGQKLMINPRDMFDYLNK